MKFLLITRTDWDEPPRSRHQLAQCLAKKHEIVFVALNSIGKPKINYTKPLRNFTLATPNWFIAGKVLWRIPLINEIYQFWLYKKLSEKYSNYIIINFDITAFPIFRFFKDVVYYCGDDFLALKRSRLVLVSLYWYLTQKLVSQYAIFCVSVSKYLQQKLSLYNNNSYLLLTAASDLPSKKCIYLASEGKKRILVYVGWLSKLDANWVSALAKNKRNSIFLIGPYSKKQGNHYDGYKNIKTVGEKNGEELDSYLSSADVCIAPYIDNKDTEKVYTMPNKFWLYLSHGKPIVTRKINNLAELPDKFVYQSETQTDFINNIDKAVLEDSPHIFEHRARFIQQNTWDKRVTGLINHLSEYNEPRK